MKIINTTVSCIYEGLHILIYRTLKCGNYLKIYQRCYISQCQPQTWVPKITIISPILPFSLHRLKKCPLQKLHKEEVVTHNSNPWIVKEQKIELYSTAPGELL